MLRIQHIEDLCKQAQHGEHYDHCADQTLNDRHGTHPPFLVILETFLNIVMIALQGAKNLCSKGFLFPSTPPNLPFKNLL